MGRACTVAVDAMGGDRAPGEIVAGALQAARELDVAVLIVGQPDAIAPLLPAGEPPEGVEIVPASEVVAMHDDPAASVRTKKDSSLVRAAEAVRDGRAQAMVGAGNTGATMASALLRWG
ncbi:MAG: phosphate acyltransferase PlsX, partial [Acidimicrobiia bacterium]